MKLTKAQFPLAKLLQRGTVIWGRKKMLRNTFWKTLVMMAIHFHWDHDF